MPINNIEEIELAITFIPPNLPRETWVSIGMALYSEIGISAGDLFHKWSSGDPHYTYKECESTWKSFKNVSKVTIATLFKVAMNYGYKPRKEKLTLDEQRQIKQYKKKERDIKLAEEKKHEEKWRAVVCEAGKDIFSRMVNHGSSPYLNKKCVYAFGIGFPSSPLLLRLFESEYRYEILTGYKNISFFLRSKNENDKFRHIKKGVFCVPIFDKNDQLVNLQIVYQAGGKSFLPGQKSGCYSPLNPLHDGQPICLGEGYATMASVHMATGLASVAAFDAGNLPKVAMILQGKFSKSKIIVCGDDDTANPNNPGRANAIKAADLCHGLAIFPKFDSAEIAAYYQLSVKGKYPNRFTEKPQIDIPPSFTAGRTSYL